MSALIRCPSCNESLAEVCDLYLALRRYKIDKMMEEKANVGKLGRQLEIDSDMDIYTDDCLDYIQVDRICCRRVLITHFQLEDLIYDTR